MEQNHYVGACLNLAAESEPMIRIRDIPNGFILDMDQSIAEHFQSTDICTVHISPGCRPGRSLVALVYKSKTAARHTPIENLRG